MKRILSVILVFSLLLCVFAGCGSQPAESESSSDDSSGAAVAQTLTAVIYDRGGDEEYWKAVIAAFEEANPGVTVDAYIGDNAAYVLRDNVLAGAAPDFVALPSDEETGVTKALVLDKALLAIDDVERTASTLLLSGAMQNAASRPYGDGAAYLAPLFFNVDGLIYNKTLLEEKGWSLPTTWEEFLALGETAKKEKVDLFAYAGEKQETLMPMFASAVAGSAGDEALDSLLRYTSDWSGDAVKAVFENVLGLSEYTADGSAGYDVDSLAAAFAKGDILFMPGDAETLASLRGEKLDEATSESQDSEASSSESEQAAEGAGDTTEYGFAAYPVLAAGDDSVASISFTEMYIPYEADNADLAKKFMIFQYSDAAAKLAAEKTGEVTPVLKALDIAKAAGISGSRLDTYAILDKTVAAPVFMNVSAENETMSDEFLSAFAGLLAGNSKVDATVEKLNGLYQEMQ